MSLEEGSAAAADYTTCGQRPVPASRASVAGSLRDPVRWIILGGITGGQVERQCFGRSLLERRFPVTECQDYAYRVAGSLRDAVR